MKVIIIGTGVFGLSAADHILKRPNTELSIVSRPSDLAPSDDISKIARIDYSSTERMLEAQAAYSQWGHHEFFSQNQRVIGRVMIYESDDTTHKDINKARESLHLPGRPACGPELMKRHFETFSAPETLTYVYSDDDRIIDWQPCISQARKRAGAACISTGGRMYESGVKTLVHTDSRVTEIELDNGERIDAATAQIILAPGPWLVQILNASAISLPPPDRIPTATGLFSYLVQLRDDQAEIFRQKPIVSHDGKVDFLPPASMESTTCKMTWIEPFTNGPPEFQVQDLSRSALAKSHMLKAVEWARTFLPGLRGAHIISVTSYWDGVTTTQDPIIAQHPVVKNLFLAAGGSYNRAKDLPTMGEMIARLVEGRPIADRYGWRPQNVPSQHDQPRLVGRGEFSAMEKQAEEHVRAVMGEEADTDIFDLMSGRSNFVVI